MEPENKPPAHLDFKKLTWVAATLVALATFIVYLPALQNGFVNWDDNVYVYENRHIQIIDFDFLKWIFTVEANPTWHPLTLLSLAIDYALWGLNPLGHHLTNILFHTANTFLVFILVVRLIECKTITNTTPPSSFFNKEGARRRYPSSLIAASVTALLFGIHPLRVESVVWVSERKDVLCAFFFLLSLLSYLKYTSADNSKKSLFYAASLIYFTLALMSKPMAVSLPIVLLIIDCYPLNRLKAEEGLYKKILIEKIPFLVLSFLISLMAVWAQYSGEALSSLEELSFIDRIFISIRAYVFYLAKMILPFNLAPFYPYTKLAYFTYEYLGSLILLLAITLFLLFKKNRLYSTIWLYYIITLLPVIGVVKIGAFVAADRYTYLPSIGPFLLAGLGIAAIFERCSKRQYQVFIITALLLVLALLGIKTTTQIVIWKDSIALWSYEIKHFPDTVYIAYNNRGTAYRKVGDQQLAIKDFDTAIKLNPKYTEAYYNRGNAHSSLENYQQAIKDFSKAIELNPEYQEAYNNRGITYMILSDYQEAIKDISMVIKLNPGDAKAYNLRGAVYVNVGDYRQAIEDLDIAVKLKAGFADAYYNRGTTYRILGDNHKAVNDFSTAITLNPQYAEAYNNRGNAYRDLGNYQKAIEDYSMAVKLNPQDAIAYKNRGIAYKNMGNHEQAIKDSQRADELNLIKQSNHPPPSSSSGYP